ncbi:MAG: glutamate--tRNA ligase [Gemmatimonadetes bacterium]|nr:glutamate--tRNA ligase [Gemmatimonadota bacterium]|tara:strand:+ start:2070 stop:3500 length:1431 start_codon:yes stop_codon:yes gene_type:complete
MSTEVLRFAPSPTGGFHVGNARTALFNYLYVRHYGGTLKLRIEDTDATRSTDDSLKTIADGLDWMGLAFDGDPVFQSQNEASHREAAQRLLESGAAYKFYATAEELEEIRKQAQKEKRAPRYPRQTPEEQDEKEAAGVPGATFFAVPDGETVWDDAIRGGSRWDNGVIGDFVIARSDGSPVYHLAVVVDDHEMGVTFALRGADHISNTPKQIMLFEALGWDVPRYGHSTLLKATDGSKLSKRKGSTTVVEYQQDGFTPSAFVNFLALLGWAPGDGREVYTLDELVDAFTIEGTLKKDAIFDETKLTWLNGEHFRMKSVDELLGLAKGAWVKAGLLADGDTSREVELRKIVALMQPRVEKVDDFAKAFYFFKDPDSYDEAVYKKHWKTDTTERITMLVERLRGLEVFGESGIEGAVRSLAGELGLSASKLIHPTRLSLCGVGFGPGLFELMEVLGQATCIRRLERALDVLSPKQEVS